jgi:hypothetical protein
LENRQRTSIPLTRRLLQISFDDLDQFLACRRDGGVFLGIGLQKMQAYFDLSDYLEVPVYRPELE